MRPLEHKLLRLGIIAVVLTGYIYPLTLAIPLLDPDEGLHAAIAQEMVETGNYLVPRFLGETFPDKPILYFLAQAVSLRVFGMNEAAIRLPGVLFALFGAWTTWLCGKRLFDRRVGLLATLISLTLLLPLCIVQSPVHDIALVPFTNLLILNLWGLRQAPPERKRKRLIVFASVAAALSLLTKGLIGVAVVSVGYFIHAIWQRQLRRDTVQTFAVILLGGIGFAAPWFWLMELNQPGYLRYYFVERHFLGYATATQTHGSEPWFYYLLPVFAGSLPWVAHAIPAMKELVRDQRRPNRNDAIRFVLCWFVGGFLFLSIAHSKLVTYVLPLFPAIAILVAFVWNEFLEQRFSEPCRVRIGRMFAVGTVIGIVAPLLIIACLIITCGFEPSSATWFMCAMLGLSSAAILWLFRSGRHLHGITGGAVWLTMLVACVMNGPMPHIARSYTHQSLARAANGRLGQMQPVILVGDRSGSFVFYLSADHRRTLRVRGRAFLSPTDALATRTREPAELVIPTQDALAECPELAEVITAGHWVVAKEQIEKTVLLEAKDPPNADARK